MKTNIISNNLPSRAAYVLGAVGLFVATLLPSLNLQSAHAASIEARQLTLTSSASGNVSTDLAGNAVDPGDPGNGAQAGHKFDFTMPGTEETVQSIEFRYCLETAVVATCTAPTGLDLGGLTGVAAQTVAPAGDFTFDGIERDATSGNGSEENVIQLTRTNAGTVDSDTPFSFTFGSTGEGWIKNPTTDNQTFFVQITTYTDNDYTDVRDTGTVGNSTAQQIDITARVQEKIRFAVGKDAPAAPDGPCSNPFSDDGAITLGDSDGILEVTTPYDENSYFRLSTNALNGVEIQYSGNTLESGDNDIDPLTPSEIALAGTEGFGLGINIEAGEYEFNQLEAAANYDAAAGDLGVDAEFGFETSSATTPVTIADAESFVACDTGVIRYAANISTTTAAGVYTTTITYIAVPAF